MMETRPAIPDAFTVDVERLTYGPDALSHHEHCVVFVPFAAPGDRAEVRVDERRRGYVRARTTRLVVPGPERVLPFCPVFERCGGCQWQHIATEAQRAAKRAVVASSWRGWVGCAMSTSVPRSVRDRAVPTAPASPWPCTSAGSATIARVPRPGGRLRLPHRHRSRERRHPDGGGVDRSRRATAHRPHDRGRAAWRRAGG